MGDSANGRGWSRRRATSLLRRPIHLRPHGLPGRHGEVPLWRYGQGTSIRNLELVSGTKGFMREWPYPCVSSSLSSPFSMVQKFGDTMGLPISSMGIRARLLPLSVISPPVCS